jgi:Zn-dependent metalloprotease
MGRIWYRALTLYVGRRARFVDFAEATLAAAADLYGEAGAERETVARAWQAVGVL